MKLQGIDLTPYSNLSFDVKADPPGVPEMKVELKRANGSEASVICIPDITDDWQTISVNLSDFGPSYAAPLSNLTEMEELVLDGGKGGGEFRTDLLGQG